VERQLDACSHGAQLRRLPDSSLASHKHHRAATRPHGFNGCRKGLKLSLTLEHRSTPTIVTAPLTPALRSQVQCARRRRVGRSDLARRAL
jgi:hypothetical protein